MKINTNKTKVVIGPWGQHNHTLLKTDQGTIEQVHKFKLLEVCLDSPLILTKKTLIIF